MQRRKELRKLPEFSDAPVVRKRLPSREFARMPMEETFMGKVSRVAGSITRACRRAVHGMKREEHKKIHVPLEVVAKTYSESGAIAAKKAA